MSNNITSQEKQDAAFRVFGFASGEARKNFVIFIIITLLASNIFFIRQNISLTNRIQDMNTKHNELILSLSSQITDEVRKQIRPTQEKINSTTDKVDDIVTKIQEDFDNHVK